MCQARRYEQRGGTLLLLVLLGLLSLARSVAAGEQLLFGPTQYTRTAGAPNQFMETLALPPTLVPPFRLHVQNGYPDGTDRVSGATILVNGMQAAGPSEFSQQVEVFDRVVALQASNTLQVRLTSKPGSFLVLTLYGTLPPPTISKLEPPALPITEGGIGTLTATISAVQPAETSIGLRSNNTNAATVPTTVTVPAGQLSVAVPVAARSSGSADITATLNGSTAQSTITVAPANPTLTSLLPATLQVTQGAAGTLAVTISAAQGIDTLIALTSSNASLVSLPPSGTVTVPAGQISQAFAVFGVGQGTATITASLSGTAAESQVTVVLPFPMVVSLLPPTLPLAEGSAGTLTVILNASQPSDTDVILSTSDASIAGLPGDRLTVPAHTVQAAFTVTGRKRGTATVTASLSGTSATAAVEVQAPTPTVQGLTCPPTLTIGATSVCTLILNAAQPKETNVTLGASDPGIVGVQASVTVPADTLAASFAVSGLGVGSVTLSAGPLNGTSQTAAIQVVPPPPTIVSLTPGTAAIFVGATATLTLTLNAPQLEDTAIPLASSSVGIVSVPATVTVPLGTSAASLTVTGLLPGTASIMAGPLHGTQAQSTITVNQLPPAITALMPTTLSLPKGKTGILTVAIAPVQAEPTVVALASDGPSVEVPPNVTVPAGSAQAEFSVIARNEGTAVITAGVLSDTSQMATVTVTPPELVAVAVTPAAPTIAKGETQAFTATGTYTDASTQDLSGTATWTSSDEHVATISSPGGGATGRGVGRTTITATLDGASVTAILTVDPPRLKSLTLRPEAPSRFVGETLQFQATGILTDGSILDQTAQVGWESSAPGVAIISASGLATAVGPGTTTITATHSEGVSVSTTLAVRFPLPTVAGFTPASGRVGDGVTLTGTGLLAVAGVGFNGVPASSFSVLSASSITATVPPGATTGPLSVTTPGGAAISKGHFIVLPTQDIAIIVEPSTVTAIAGTSVALKVSTAATGGFTGLTTLSTGSLPAGVTAVFSTPALGPNAAGLLTLTTSGSTPSPAVIQVVGMATLGGTPVTRTATGTLTIQPMGQTVLAGRVLDENNQPVAGVSIKQGGSTLATLGVTDAAGNFLVSLSVAGSQVFLIDGSTANTPTASFATIPVTVLIQPGVVNTLGFVPHLHAQPVTQPLPVAPATAKPITFADLPDFQLTIPAGVRIIGWDGQPNTQIGVRPVPVDRLAVPALPAGVDMNVVYMFSFGKVGGGTPTSPIPVTAPNAIGAFPGQQVELWYFNEAPDGSAPNAWQMFGLGTVSSDGRLIVSNPGVGIPRFCCGAWGVRIPPPPPNTPPEEAAKDPCPDGCDGSAQGGDPVELSSGIFLHRWTDLTLAGRIPAVLTRIYRTNDPTVGPFGIGTSTSYDAYLRQKTADAVLVFLPGNSKSWWAKQPDGSFSVSGKGTFRGARLTKNGDATWALRYKDGRVWQFSSAGWLIAQQDRNGNLLAIARDSQNRLTTLREPTGRELSFSYSGIDTKIQSVTDPLGRQVRYQYDGINRLTQVTDPAGGIWQYTYDGSHRMLTVTNPRSILQTQNAYDAAGRVATQTLADTGVTRFDYTVVAGTIAATTVTDATGAARTTRFAGGYPIEQTDGLGQAAKILRAAGTNLVQSQIDPLGRATQFQYDAAGNVTQQSDPLNQVWRVTYDPTFNQPLTTTDPLNQTTTLGYDARGNLSSILDPLNHATTLSYNGAGDLTAITDALGHTTTFEYDTVGNLVAAVDPLGNRTQRTYDAASRLIAMKDPKGVETQFSYDALDRVITITDPLGGTTWFGYDQMGNLLTVIDARGNMTRHTYDGMNRLVTRTDALNRSEYFTYDLAGNLKTTTDRKGQVTTHTYDAQNLRIRSDYADGSSIAYTYDPAGNLLMATDSLAGPIARSYDALNRLVSEVSPQGAITYAYDPLSRRSHMQANGLPPATYAYDSASHLTGITQDPQTAVLAYDAGNRRTSLTLPNGISITYAYDEASRLVGQTYAGPNGVLGDLTYAYDATGNRTATGGSWARSLLPASVQTTTYDQANEQLAFGDVAQTFDPNGNLLTQTDAAGTTTYAWDARNSLIAMSGSTVSASFAYDAVGRRIMKTINGQSTTFLYDGLDVIRESGPGGDVSYLRTLAIDEALTRTEASGTSSYLADALGSTLALADATGALPTTYTYAPFGDTAVTGSLSANPFQFTGRENDGTGLYYYRARYYGPRSRRFISADPLGIEGGVNPYRYVTNNPIIWVDPYGLSPLSLDDISRLALQNNRSGQSNELIICVIYKESAFNPDVMQRAPNTARGLMGITRAAAGEIGSDYNKLSDPSINIYTGTRYLYRRINWRSYGNGSVKMGLAGYGEGVAYAESILKCEECMHQNSTKNSSCKTKECLLPLHGGK